MPKRLLISSAVVLLGVAIWMALHWPTLNWQPAGRITSEDAQEIRGAVSEIRKKRLLQSLKAWDLRDVRRNLQEQRVGRIRVFDSDPPDEVRVEGRHWDYQLHYYSSRGWQVYSLGHRGDPVGNYKNWLASRTQDSSSDLEMKRLPSSAESDDKRASAVMGLLRSEIRTYRERNGQLPPNLEAFADEKLRLWLRDSTNRASVTYDPGGSAQNPMPRLTVSAGMTLLTTQGPEF